MTWKALSWERSILEAPGRKAMRASHARAPNKKGQERWRGRNQRRRRNQKSGVCREPRGGRAGGTEMIGGSKRDACVVGA